MSYNSPTPSLSNSPIATPSINKMMQNSPMSIQLQIRALERTISSNKARIDELEGDLLERDRTITMLKSQVQGISEKKDRLKEENARIPLLEEETKDQNEKIQDISYHLDQAQKKCNLLREELNKANRKLAQSENEAIELAQELDEYREDSKAFAKKHESCSAEKDNLNQQIESSNREISRLENIIRKQAAEMEEYKRDMTLNKKIAQEEKDKEIDQIVSTYTETQQESARRIRKLEDDADILKEKHTIALMSLDSKTAEFEKEIRSLNRQISDLKDQMKSEQTSAQQKMECLNGKLEEKESYVIELETTRSNMERKILDLNKSLEENVIELETTRSTMEHKILDLTKSLEEKSVDIAQKDQEIDQLRNKLQPTEEKLAKYGSELMKMGEQYKLLLEQLKNRDGIIKQKEDERTTLVKKIDAMESQLKEKQQQINELFHSPRESDFCQSPRRSASSVSLKSTKSFQIPHRPPTGMSTYSMPAGMQANTLDFAAEEEPTIVMNAGTNKHVYDRQAPAPASDVEVEISTIDNEARFRELRERNRKTLPHLRSAYSAEIQEMPLDFNTRNDILKCMDENTPPIKPTILKRTVKQPQNEPHIRPLADVPIELTRSRSSQSSTRSFKEKGVSFFSNPLKNRNEDQSSSNGSSEKHGSAKKPPRKSLSRLFKHKN